MSDEGPTEREWLEGLARDSQNISDATSDTADIPCSCTHKYHYHDRQWGTCDVVGCLCDGYREAF